MRTIKRNASFVMVFLLGILNITFASCSGESNEEGSKSSETISTLRANKWISRDVSSGEGNDDHIWVDVESTTLYFTSDDAGVVYWIQKDYDSDLGNNRTYDYEPFTYTVDGNKVIVKTETDTNTLTLLGNYLSDDDYIYEATPISSGDYELLNKISPKTGKCGNSLSYIYYPKTHALSIYGTGKMNDYSTTNQPWHNFYIENVEIQDGCTSIGANAFTNIQHVTSVELPRTLTEIGANSFAGTLITKLTIYDNVIKIGEGAFFGCNYLKTVYLSDNIEEIGADAFHACPVSETAFSLPKTLKHIGDRAFMGWKIGTLTLNNDLETIGNACFTGVKGTINIPNSVKSVGGLAFEGSFNKVVIGTGLTDLAKSAFASTASSGQFYVNLGVPLTMDGCIFNGNVSDDDIQKKWTLYVPKGSKTAYSSNVYWKKFGSIVEDASLTSGNGEPDDSGNNGNGEPGNDDGQLVPKYDYKNLTYMIDGVTYKMVLVEGGTFAPFYIMQTELPPNASLMIGNEYVGVLNQNLDDGVIKSELRIFMEKLREATGIAFRLPTTSEWMFAARGGKYSKGFTYSGSNSIDDVAWHKGNSNYRIHDVATKKPNELGLYDMSGNYAEVCNDTDDLYYIDGNLCGGNWSEEAKFCKSTYAKPQPTSGKLGDTRYKNKFAFNPKYETIRLVYSVPK